jgi:UDP-N-acetylmuramoyl-L-alanine---L-glutamate ligase
VHSQSADACVYTARLLCLTATVTIHFDALRLHRSAIWGFGREGRAALAAFRARYPEKRLALILSPEEAQAWDFTDDPNLELITAEPTSGVLAQYGTIIKSPGISPYTQACDWARFRGTRFISGCGLWFGEHAADRTVCITGTKGKSTVSALTAHLLRAAGQLTALVGNIGVPLLEVMDPDPKPDYWVIELSSYQTHDFSGVPAIACVLNLFPEHLPWHGSEERYYSDKLRILADGKAEVIILNGADKTLVKLAGPIERGFYFNVPNGWHVKDGFVHYQETPVLDLKDVRLPGRHNAENICAALTIIQACGLDAQALAKEVSSFRPLPHRLQQLGARGGLEYIDDSIATTPHATAAAIESVHQGFGAERPMSVIVGGFDRGLDWDCFVDCVQQFPVHAVIAAGANVDRIIEALAKRVRTLPVQLDTKRVPGAVYFSQVEDLAAATELAQKVTPRNGVVLLSPGAPSFDAFASYAERGRAFARYAGFGDLSTHAIEGLGIA